MDINLNNVSAASAAAAAASAAAAAEADELIIPQIETAEVILKGAGVTISATKMSSDIEKTVALLNQQTDDTRKNSVVSTLASLSAAFATFAKQTQEAMSQISTATETLANDQKDLDDLTGKLEEAKTALADAEKAEADAKAAKDSATDALNALVQNEGESDEDFAARKAAAEQDVTDADEDISDAIEAQDAAKDRITALEDRVEAAAKKVEADEKEIENLYDSLDFPARSKLTEALRVSASKTPNGNPLNPEEDDEKDGAVNAEVNAYKKPVEILREVLEKRTLENVDDISKHRETNV